VRRLWSGPLLVMCQVSEFERESPRTGAPRDLRVDDDRGRVDDGSVRGEARGDARGVLRQNCSSSAGGSAARTRIRRTNVVPRYRTSLWRMQAYSLTFRKRTSRAGRGKPIDHGRTRGPCSRSGFHRPLKRSDIELAPHLVSRIILQPARFPRGIVGLSFLQSQTGRRTFTCPSTSGGFPGRAGRSSPKGCRASCSRGRGGIVSYLEPAMCRYFRAGDPSPPRARLMKLATPRDCRVRAAIRARSKSAT